jgi:AraC-like DNA-binding protein
MSDHIIYFAHTNVDLRIGDRYLQLRAGDVILLPAETPYSIGRKNDRWCHSWLRFGGSDVETLLGGCGLASDRVHVFAGGEPCSRWLLEIHREAENALGRNVPVLESLFAVMIWDILRRGTNTGTPIASEGLLRSKEHIERHYRERISVDQLARIAGLSPTHFIRRFRQCFGVPPVRYANHLKLRHAADLLANPALNISQVAAESGFEDLFSFSRSFKRFFAAGPRAYRRKMSVTKRTSRRSKASS